MKAVAAEISVTCTSVEMGAVEALVCLCGEGRGVDGAGIRSATTMMPPNMIMKKAAARFTVK